MLQIKKQTDWAIRILLYLSQRRGAVTGKELAKSVGMSDKYLPHVMMLLRKAGLVTSYSGVAGGYVLLVKPEHITLLDVLSATGDYPQISCYSGDELASLSCGKSDALLNNYGYLQRISENYLNSVTVSDLISQDRMEAFFSRVDELCLMLEESDKCQKVPYGISIM